MLDREDVINDNIDGAENALTETEQPTVDAVKETFSEDSDHFEKPDDEVLSEGESSRRGKKNKGKKKRGFGSGFVTGMLVMAVLAILFTLFSPIQITRSSSNGLITEATKNKIEVLGAFIQQYYYEDVDQETLTEGLYAGLFDNLDVYSRYYTAEEYEELMETSISGTYCGIGASLQQDAETKNVTIVNVYEGSPADGAGLKAGDIIVKADSYTANTMDLSELVSHIRGEENTVVHLEIYRDGEYMEFDIARKNLTYPTVSSEMLSDQIYYIRVSEFTEATPKQFRTAVESAKKEQAKGVIVDLRSNPGGMLDSVVEMLDEILPKGLLVYTEDRAGNREEYNSTDDETLNIPLAVLVDGNSASASEIFAGAVKDRDAGTLIGTTTYGKGVVQSIRGLSDGSAVKLTTSSYFTPSGVCIQGIGIDPDIELEYEFQGGEDDDYSYDLDNQILKAIEVLKGQQ